MTQPVLEMDRRDTALYWWPVIARVSALLIGFYEAAFDSLDKPSVMAFAGALILAPVVTDAQRKRNRLRSLDEDDL